MKQSPLRGLKEELRIQKELYKLSCTRTPSHGFEIQPTLFCKPSDLICKEGRVKRRERGREGGKEKGRDREQPVEPGGGRHWLEG